MKPQQLPYQQDSLDRASQQLGRNKSITSQSQPHYRQDLLLKNIYRQQLDQIMRQKNQQKQIEKNRQKIDRQMYNKRMQQGQEAEKLKDLSYKNYYQILMNSQNNKTKNYVQLNKERDQVKQKLIQQGIKQQQYRSQQWQQRQFQRVQNMKKLYQQQLARQVNQKNKKQAVQRQSRIKQQQQFNKITYTPQQIAQYEKRKKLAQMSKYKEDLDKISPKIGQKTRVMTGSTIVNGRTSNDFNIFNQRIHNPMTNPLPYNIQNPYILREFNRRQGTGNYSGYIQSKK